MMNGGKRYASTDGAIAPSSVGPSRIPASTSPITGGCPIRPIRFRTSRAKRITTAIDSISRPKICSFVGGFAGCAVVPGFGSFATKRAWSRVQPGSERRTWSGARRRQSFADDPPAHSTVPDRTPWRKRSSPCSAPLASTNCPDWFRTSFPAPPAHGPRAA